MKLKRKRKPAIARKVAKKNGRVLPRKSIAGSKAGSYNCPKEFGGKQYSGMQVGRSHKWYYDKGEWKETKITSDLWRIFYSVTKRRAGRAPEGSGAEVGTAYHWYIAAHQRVQKLNANDYSTTLMGLKYKVAHKRAKTDKWNASMPTQRKHLISFLKEWIDASESDAITFEFEYKETQYKGEAIPVPEACEEGKCYQFDVSLNNESMGIIREGKSGWKMDNQKDQKFVDAIGRSIEENYV